LVILEEHGTRPLSYEGINMKADIHPKYEEIKVTCSCGNTFKTRSSLCDALHIDVCDKCHPFYTGQQKIVDSAGRVERFKEKYKSFPAGKKAAKKDE
jgi:large subunit ribosomal protein L31